MFTLRHLGAPPATPSAGSPVPSTSSSSSLTFWEEAGGDHALALCPRRSRILVESSCWAIVLATNLLTTLPSSRWFGQNSQPPCSDMSTTSAHHNVSAALYNDFKGRASSRSEREWSVVIPEGPELDDVLSTLRKERRGQLVSTGEARKSIADRHEWQGFQAIGKSNGQTMENAVGRSLSGRGRIPSTRPVTSHFSSPPSRLPRCPRPP